MRNLKRALSLTLASVMLLGMMVVGSSAAAGYSDVAETDNVEAIEVLQAIGVMVGDDNGFRPGDSVNRAEMAVVMAKLLNLDYNYYSATCPFDDVYDWARGYVGACYANGIVSGRGEGVYDPGTTVTAVEAASMMLRALGYFKYQSDYADGFEVATVRQANTIGLFNGVNSSTNAPLTRNQVAQMALNAIKSGVVTADGNTTNFVDASGNLIGTVGRVNYVFVTSNKGYATAISGVRASSMGSANDAPIVELGEQLYDGKLKLTDTIDAFGRPARYWEFDAKAVGTYVKEELIRETYTKKVTGRDLYDLLGSTTIKDYDLDVYIDGVEDPAINENLFDARHLVRTYNVGVGATGNGVLTQVFVDQDKKLVTISVINTYLALADEDFDDRYDNVDITVYGINEVVKDEYVKNAKNDDGTSAGQNEGFTLEIEDFPSITAVKDGDAFLVTVAQGEVQTIAEPEIMADAQITSFKVGSWIVSGGNQYDFASAAEYECETLYDWTAKDNAVVNLKEINYNIYLDKYGYAVGVKEVERVSNYVFITGVDTNTNNRYAVQADATGIFLDGTVEAMKLDMRAVRDLKDGGATYNALTNGTKGGSLVNKWFTYTVGNDGVYSVSVVGTSADIDNPAIKARAGQYRTLNKVDANLGTAPAYEALGTATHGVDTVEGPKSIALRGTYSPSDKWYSVYGDDQSVYITAELTTITDATTKDIVNVISGVDSVAVGIDNANIEVYSETKAKAQDLGTAIYTAYGTYTLFDKDGDVIAAVVVGEDSGATTNLVYTHKGMNSETDNNAADSRANASKGTYTWTRYVVANGEETLLTEVGSGLSELKSMSNNTWYVVKYNAKGEVKNVYPAWDLTGKGLIDADAKNLLADVDRLEDRYVNNIEELNQATNKNTTALYEVGSYNNTTDLRVGSISRMYDKPSVDNHTFYVKTATSAGLHQGFRVSDDVKTVFIQTNNGETSTAFESGYSRLEKVVGRLHDRDDKAGTIGYNYEVSAVMENGKAVVVVIRDMNYVGAVIGKPTGKYTVQFQPGFWSDERNVFYVGVNKLGENDFFNVDRNYDAFRVSADTNDVQVVRKNATDEEFGLPYEDLVIGEYKDPVLGYVIGTVDRSGRVLSFEVKGDCTLYSPLRFWTAPTVTPDSTAPGFTPDKPTVPQPIGSTTYPMWIRDAAHKNSALPKAAGDAVTEFVKGNYYTVTVEVDGVEETFTNIQCQYNGFLLVNIKLSPADLIVEKNIDVVLTSVVEGEGSTEATEYMVTVPAGVTVTYKADGKAVTTGMVAKGTVIVVEPSADAAKVVKVNGTAITEKTEVTVDKAITVTLEEVAQDEVTLSVNKTGTGDAALDPTTVKKGQSATLTVSGTAQGATVTVTAEGLTVVNNNDGTWTITVPADFAGTSATVNVTITDKAESDITVTITGASAPYTIKVSYTGGEPAEADLVAAINAQLVKDGKTEVVDSISRGTAWDAEGNSVGTINTVAGHNIYVNGAQLKDADGNPVTVSSETFGATPIPYTGTAAFLANKDDWTKGYAVTGAISKSASLSEADAKALTGDLYLVDAYKLPVASQGSTLTSVTYNDGEETTVAQGSAADLYIPQNGSIVATGKLTSGSTHVKLTINSKDYGTAQAIAAEPAEFTVNMAELADDMFTSAGTIGVIAEAATSSYTVKVDGATLTYNTTSALTDKIKIALGPKDPVITNGTYVLKAADMTSYMDASSAKTVTVSGGDTTEVTLALSSGNFTADSKNVIELVMATKVTFKDEASLGMVFNAGAADVDISDNDSYYFVEGTNVQFAQKTGNDTWKATVKVGPKDATDLTGASYTPSGADDIVITFLKAVEALELTAIDLGVDTDLTVNGILGSVTEVTVVASSEEMDATEKTVTFKIEPADGYYIDGGITVTAGAAGTGKYPMSDIQTSLDAASGELTITFTYGEKVT